MTSQAIASRASADVRAERARVRRDLRSGVLSLAAVILDPPACVVSVPLFEIVRWQRFFGAYRLRLLGRRAVADGINLALTVGMASAGTREWVVFYGQPTQGRAR